MGTAPQITHLQTRLKAFLERLGRTVEAPRPGQLQSRHRTALVEEKTKFKLVESGTDKPIIDAINILAPHLTIPDPDPRRQCYYFDEFLDHTIQATELARGLIEDEEIAELRAYFIPQRLSSEGRPLDADSVTYFFSDWLTSPDKRLLAVLAPAGYGKTVLTCELAYQMARRYLDAPKNRKPACPYLVPFGQFRRLASFEAMVLSSLQRKGVTDYTAGAFAYLVQENRLVLILDGFDELLEERPDEARKNLRELIETLEGRGKVVVTARSTFFRTSDEVSDFLEYYLDPEQVSAIELQPFDAEQRHQFLENYIDRPEDLSRALQVVDSANLAEAMGSPLLLKETVQALATKNGAPGFDASATRRGLFAALEASVYERERLRHGHQFSDDEQRRFLETLGREMLAANSRGFDWDSIRVVALESVLDETETPDTELNRLADHHFLTVRSERGDVQFNHQVFREYFQARSVLRAFDTGRDHWFLDTMAIRPLPEEVRAFIAELDVRGETARRLLTACGESARRSARFVNNVAALIAAYGEREVLDTFLRVVPSDVPLGFRIESLDLSDSQWTDRYLHGMEFVNCSLMGATFVGAHISEMALLHTNVRNARFDETRIDSLTVDRGERIFGRPDVLATLDRLGAITGLERPDVRASLVQEGRLQLIELIRGRLNRFYVAGRSDTEDSRWDSSIQERNLYGGVNPAAAKFVKSKLVPRMVSVGILERSRAHGLVIYRLTDAAEDDARALMERDEVTGLVAELVERLSGREQAAA
jgi:hypothetical protein